MSTKKKSFTITKFKNKVNREKRTFVKVIVLEDIPDEDSVTEEGVIHYTKRLGGQLHQMYVLLDYEYKG